MRMWRASGLLLSLSMRTTPPDSTSGVVAHVYTAYQPDLT